MATAVLIVIGAGALAVLASWFIWWGTKRSPVWSMAAGALLGFAVVASVLLIALMTRPAVR